MHTMARTVSVARHCEHAFSKPSCQEIRLLAGRGIEGDAHCGETVKHRSRVAIDPNQPNLRQVHLIAEELFGELTQKGFWVRPGDLGENITTQGIDLLSLPVATRLRIGPQAILELTGLRNPCKQIDSFQSGLMQAVLGRDETGAITLRAGVMAIVISGGTVRAGDEIHVDLPPAPHKKLMRV